MKTSKKAKINKAKQDKIKKEQAIRRISGEEDSYSHKSYSYGGRR